jgi:hypothetical protein
MRTRSLVLAAVTAVLSFTAAASPATEVTASVPSTELAARSSDLIDRAIRALVKMEGESRITRLWVFPTGDPNAVFVHYRTTRDADAHEPGPSTEHLVLLEMNGERIANLHDLTRAPASVVASVGEEKTRAVAGLPQEPGF